MGWICLTKFILHGSVVRWALWILLTIICCIKGLQVILFNKIEASRNCPQMFFGGWQAEVSKLLHIIELIYILLERKLKYKRILYLIAEYIWLKCFRMGQLSDLLLLNKSCVNEKVHIIITPYCILVIYSYAVIMLMLLVYLSKASLPY